MTPGEASSREATVHIGDVQLEGTLTIPKGARGVVAFAHGSGSSRFSSRNRQVASALNEGGLATLLFDLLTNEEGRVDDRTRELRFDIPLLAERTTGAADWLAAQEQTRGMPIGLFGASTGAASALIAAARRPERIGAVVSRGGRPDLAADELPDVKAPTLLLVGGLDEPVISMNREASERMRCERRLEIVEGATHLFEEPGKLEEVSELAKAWFREKLLGPGSQG